MRVIYIAPKNVKKNSYAQSLHIGKTHDQHLEACCRGISFPPARQGTILSSHRVIGIATNRPTSMVLLNYA